MGQLDLSVLRAIAAATVRFLDWTGGSGDRREADGVAAVFDALVQSAGDPDGVRCPVPWQLHARSWTSSGPGPWHHELWRTAEWDAATLGEAGWCFELRRDPGYEGVAEDAARAAQYIELGLNPHGLYMEGRVIARPQDEHRFEVRLRPPPHDPVGGLSSTTLHLSQESGQPRREVRELLQEVESYARWPSVVVVPDPSPEHVGDTVMAQLVEWAFRMQRFGGTDVPDIAADAYEWWGRWARRAGRLPEVPSGDLFLVARRTVSPAHPRAHRKYWRQSLRAARADIGIVAEAARRAGIGRSTAYDRLRRTGKRAADFAREEDPTGALAAFLKRSAGQRMISGESREIVAALVKAGVNQDSARRLERRTRSLPREVRARRLRAAIERARRKSGVPGWADQ